MCVCVCVCVCVCTNTYTHYTKYLITRCKPNLISNLSWVVQVWLESITSDLVPSHLVGFDHIWPRSFPSDWGFIKFRLVLPIWLGSITSGWGPLHLAGVHDILPLRNVGFTRLSRTDRLLWVVNSQKREKPLPYANPAQMIRNDIRHKTAAFRI